ncbi:Hypothetical predicted protein [Octopus vulgaris]|uniref:Uncharacterized protein n=1 Tax=Octopus vulgaris TaxID=6645 RepID=A0AA36AVB5_OCTVU|nr:Hypothetical predicted protein [Octopus vulgaris]
MTSVKVARHDNIGFFESLDDKSHLSKNNLPEYSIGTTFQNRDNHSNPSAEDIVYNEAVMRGAFVQFLRRLADQVENGIIPLFDAMTFSPYNTISNNEDISHSSNTFKMSPPTPPLPQSPSQPSLAPLLPTTPEEIQMHSGCHSMLQHHQKRDTFHQQQILQQRKLLEQQQRQHQQHCEQQQLQLSHHMSEMNNINLDDDNVDGDTNNNVDDDDDDDDDRYNSDLIVESSFSSDTLNSNGQFKQETNFQLSSQEHISDGVFPEDSIKHQMVPLLSVVETSGSDTYPDIVVDNLQLQVLMDRIVNAKRPISPVSMHYFSLSILQGAINLVFSKWELKHSSGLGLRRTKAESGCPLDRRKIDAIETFYLSLCNEYQLTKVSKAIFHKAFTIKISNAKRDHRKS